MDRCNIVPITDGFTWPEPAALPADMRNVCDFNGVPWTHDYEDACVDKVEEFVRNGIEDGKAFPVPGLPVVGGVTSDVLRTFRRPRTRHCRNARV